MMMLCRAVWWVEYLLRHGHTQFLKPYSLQLRLKVKEKYFCIDNDFRWYEYHLLDVMMVIGAVILTCILITVFCCRMLFSKCCRKKEKSE